jgi:cytoskeletal protein CcmA (bactofilin family)
MEDKEGCVLIGKGVSITGNITLSGTIHIYGDVNGEVVAQEIHVGDTGKINGDIKSEVADIRGEVMNAVEVRKALMIRSTGKVAGKVLYQSIEIENGGIVDGQLEKISSKNEPKNDHVAAEKIPVNVESKK